MNEDFRDLLLALAAEGVEFVIVGAYALALLGYVARYEWVRRRSKGARACAAS